MNFRKNLEQEGAGFQLAPMVDIMFILIIFFLVTAAFSELESEIDITLPSAQKAQPLDRGPRDIVVNVRADGVIVVNRQPFPPDRLRHTLKDLAADNPDQGVIIRADAKSLHEHVVLVMDICREAGISNIAFPVIQIRESAGTP